MAWLIIWKFSKVNIKYIISIAGAAIIYKTF